MVIWDGYAERDLKFAKGRVTGLDMKSDWEISGTSEQVSPRASAATAPVPPRLGRYKLAFVFIQRLNRPCCHVYSHARKTMVN